MRSRNIAIAVAFGLAFGLPAKADIAKGGMSSRIVSDTRRGILLSSPFTALRLLAPFTSSGPAIADDANTVAHVFWDPWRTRTDPAAVGSPKPIEQERAVVWSSSLGLFVASGNTNGGNADAYVITSPDGATWTLRTTGAHTSGFDTIGLLGWNGSVFTGICDAACGSRPTATSTDGINWAVGPVGGLAGFQPHTRPVWNGSVWAIAGLSGTVSATSTDGATWTNQTIPTGGYNGLAWGNGTFVAVGNSGVVSTSPNGTAWTAQTPPTASNFFAVEWNGTVFAAVGASVAATSTNGVSWTLRTIPAGNYLHVAWNSTYFLAVGSNLSATSPDGITWTARSAPGTFNASTSLGGNGLAWNGTTWVAVTGNTADPRILSGTSQVALGLPGAIVDTKGNSWTQNGTVPQVTTSPLYPSGFADVAKPGAGPFSDANYYSLTAAGLNFAGDFTACFVLLDEAGNSVDNVVFSSSGLASTDGWYVQRTSLAARLVLNSAGGTSGVASANTMARGPNVYCAGRSGSTQFVKLNLGTTASTAVVASYVPGTRATRIGRYEGAGLPWASKSFEMWYSSTAWSEANATAIQNLAFGHVAATGQTLTVTRATTATAEPKAGESPSLYIWPAGVLRITENGVLLEAAATNLLLQSEALNNAAWATSGVCTITADQAVFVDGQTTMEKVQCTGINDSRFQTTAAFGSTTGPITGSVWMAATTGTQVESMAINCAGGAIATCACARGDGGACTAVIIGTNCVAYGTVGTTPVRMSATETCSAAVTTSSFHAHDGQEGTTANVAGYFGGAQLEIAGYASSYIPTTTVTVARNAEIVTVANPLPVGPFCVSGTWTPASLTTWSTISRGAWLFGTTGTNSVRMELIAGGAVRIQAWDASSGLKQWDTAGGVMSGTTPTTVVSCLDNLGAATVTANGVAQSVTPSGAGTGILNAMGQIQFNDGTLAPVAAVKNFKVCRGSNPARCQ